MEGSHIACHEISTLVHCLGEVGIHCQTGLALLPLWVCFMFLSHQQTQLFPGQSLATVVAPGGAAKEPWDLGGTALKTK